MKLGIGTKAGLTSGTILGSIYILGVIPAYLFFILAKSGLLETEPGKLGVIATVLGVIGIFSAYLTLFIGGYYQSIIHSQNFFLSQGYFLILMFSIWTISGRMFQVLYNFLPTDSGIKKGYVYSTGIWLILGVVALLLPIIINFPISKDLPSHIYTIVGWLLYGFLLGKFYDAFSKEPDAGIFYMIKKVLLRRP